MGEVIELFPKDCNLNPVEFLKSAAACIEDGRIPVPSSGIMILRGASEDQFVVYGIGLAHKDYLLQLGLMEVGKTLTTDRFLGV